MNVLETIPFDKVDISVFLIETDHLGEIFNGDDDDLRKFMHEKGYVFLRRLNIDDVYIKSTLLDKLSTLP